MITATPPTEFHACVVQNGQVVLSKGRPDVLCPWWSFSKTLLAVVTLREGIDLDQTLPDAEYNLRQLLNHSARLPCYCDLPDYHAAVAAGDAAWSMAEMMRRVRALPAKTQPDWRYSNYGYALARQRIEDLTVKSIADHVQDMAEFLGLPDVKLAETHQDFAAIHWPEAQSYDPKWVYHGCIMGPAKDAAVLLDAIANGQLLTRPQFDALNTCIDLGGAIEGRPWTRCGYGLGVMSGEMGDAGRAIGHSGAGPFSSNAVYHFPDLENPTTVAVFGHGSFEGHSENHMQTLLKEKARHPEG